MFEPGSAPQDGWILKTYEETHAGFNITRMAAWSETDSVSR
jgi:hypothetical protein